MAQVICHYYEILKVLRHRVVMDDCDIMRYCLIILSTLDIVELKALISKTNRE